MSGSSRRGRPRRSAAERERLRAQRQAAYDDAGTVERYAARHGLTYRQAYYRLTSVGVTLRPQGRPRSGSIR